MKQGKVKNQERFYWPKILGGINKFLYLYGSKVSEACQKLLTSCEMILNRVQGSRD